MDFGAIGPVDNVPVRDDAISVDEESTAARKFLATSVEGFDGHRRRFNAPDEIGELILSINGRRDGQKEHTAIAYTSAQIESSSVGCHRGLV